MDDLLYFKGYIGQLMLRVILQHSITVLANKFKDLLFFFFLPFIPLHSRT